MSIKKLTIGLLSTDRLFKVPSLWGILIDEILALRGNKLTPTFFEQIGATEQQGFVFLFDQKRENSLRIDMNGVILTKDLYDNGTHIELRDVIASFGNILNVVQKIIAIRQISRIGIVAEQYVGGAMKAPSTSMANSLTTLKIDGHPAKFGLNFQSRRTPEMLSDEALKNTEYKNVICQIYDSSLDSEHPIHNRITLSVDVQKYYAPPLKKKFLDEIELIGFDLPKEIAAVKAELRRVGLGVSDHDK